MPSASHVKCYMKCNNKKNSHMKRPIFLALVSVFLHGAIKAQVTPVFTSGTEGYKSFRIPAMVATKGGDILAFCEGRVNDSGDFGDINIVMKRSSDKGKTWHSLQVLVDYDSLQAGNPAPVVDLHDPAYPKGVVFLFYNTGNNHEGEVRKGKGLREVWFIRSTDGGKSWSAPRNITAQTHRPNQPAADPAYRFAEDWRAYANTPGHAMQFRQGRYKGRIFVAANHSVGDPKPQAGDYFAHGFYTDDHGATFSLGATLPIPGSNESMAAELPDGGLIMTTRNQKGDIRNRILAFSSDGGAHWDTAYFEKALPDPVCQGSILTVWDKRKNAVLVHCNNADQRRRDDLTLNFSKDGGKTWGGTIRVDKAQSAEKRSWTAYSDLVSTSGRTLGLLYEQDDYARIVFREMRWR